MEIDIIGSFFPTEKLINAQNRHTDNRLTNEELTHTENEAIADLVERQLEAGLSEITSGEFRRKYRDKDFYFSLNGISKVNYSSGRVYQCVETRTDLLRVTDTISYNAGHPFFSDFSFLISKSANRAVCRQALPSPANLFLTLLSTTDGHIRRIYQSVDNLLSDIALAYRNTIVRFHQLGCRRIQFDDTACGLLCQRYFTKRLLQGGMDLLDLHENIISLINSSIADKPEGMEFSLYLSGGDRDVPQWEIIPYSDNIMPKILSECEVDKFLLPMETGNDYQAEILRYIPDGIKVTLGLIDAHTPFADNPDGMMESIDGALRFVNTDRLAISPKTGFKLPGHNRRGITYSTQWEKLNQLKNIRSIAIANVID